MLPWECLLRSRQSITGTINTLIFSLDRLFYFVKINNFSIPSNTLYMFTNLNHSTNKKLQLNSDKRLERVKLNCLYGVLSLHYLIGLVNPKEPPVVKKETSENYPNCLIKHIILPMTTSINQFFQPQWLHVNN